MSERGDELLIHAMFDDPSLRSVRLDRHIIGVLQRRDANWFIVRRKAGYGHGEYDAPDGADAGPFSTALEAAGKCREHWQTVTDDERGRLARRG